MRSSARLLSIALAIFPARALADTKVDATLFGARRPLASRSDRAGLAPNDEVLRNAFGAAFGLTEAPPSGARGLVVRGGLGIEHASDCAWTDRRPSCPFPTGSSGPSGEGAFIYIPTPNRVEFGAHARLGWDFHYVAIEAGAVVYSVTDVVALPTRRDVYESHLRPDAALRIGPQFAWLALGYGTSSATTMFYPGPYVRGHLDFAPCGATLGVADATQDERGFYRGDLDVACRVVRNVSAGTGLGVMHERAMHGLVAWTGELRLFASLRFD